MMRYFLTASTIFVQNRKSEVLLKDIKKSFRVQFGRTNFPTLAASIIVVLFGIKEYLRRRFVGDVRVPRTSYRLFNTVYKHKEQLSRFSTNAGVPSKITYNWSEQTER